MASKFNMWIEYNLVGHREAALKYYESIEKNPMMSKLTTWFKSMLQNEENKSVIFSEWNFPTVVFPTLAENMMEGVAKTIREQEPNAIVTWKKVEPEVVASV